MVQFVESVVKKLMKIRGERGKREEKGKVC